MNHEWFGDSFDIVKRFFIGVLKKEGYSVFIDPMFTDEWEGQENLFLDFVGAPVFDGSNRSGRKTALLLDPDTGIGKKSTDKHITIDDVLHALEQHDLVFSFDQSFSRNQGAEDQMAGKLRLLREHGAIGFYYNSHARFLFAAKTKQELARVSTAILSTGLPKRRLIRA